VFANNQTAAVVLLTGPETAARVSGKSSPLQCTLLRPVPACENCPRERRRRRRKEAGKRVSYTREESMWRTMCLYTGASKVEGVSARQPGRTGLAVCGSRKAGACWCTVPRGTIATFILSVHRPPVVVPPQTTAPFSCAAKTIFTVM
jgi:hypothetical protein